MYQLESAVGKLRKTGSRWQAVAIGEVAMSVLYTEYASIIAVLSNSFLPQPVSLDLELIKASYASSPLTFNEMLGALGNASLPTTPVLPELKTRHAIYSDAFRAGYKVNSFSPAGHVNSNVLPGDRHWLALTKPEVDYTLFYKSCLVSINGLVHLTDTDGQAVYVVDGMKSCRQSGRNQIGITSFRELGALEFVPITPQMVHRRYPDRPLAKGLYLDIGTAKPGKYAMLVLGGYLHVLDSSTFRQVADSIYVIDFQNLPWRDRYYESRGLIDLSSFNLEVTTANEDQLVDAQLYSDEVLTQYATLSQSFLAFIDNPNLFVEREALRRTVLPNIYTSYSQPRFPLVLGVGKLGDYWRTYEHGQWSVTVNDGLRENYVFNTTPEHNLLSIDNTVSPFDDLELSRAQFLKIGSDLHLNTGA